MSRSSKWWSLALALMGAVAAPAQAAGTPAPGCRPPGVMRDVAEGTGGSLPDLGLDSVPLSFVRLGGTVYFSADDGQHGVELWKSDGTAAGTRLVKDIRPGFGDATPREMVVFGGALLFTAQDGEHGFELWRTDGTEAGTTTVRELSPGTEGGNLTDMVVVGRNAYFFADDHEVGRELWATDGSLAGTRLIKDIRPGASGSASVRSLRAVGNTLFFTADDGVHGLELWKSDGTEAGTVLVKDLSPGASSGRPTLLTAVGNTLFFSASDGTSADDLWMSDGTAAGTHVVAPSLFGGAVDHPAPDALTPVGDKLFFQLDEGVSGPELWVSDGTEAGTRRVKDIRSGTEGSNPTSLVSVGGLLYFSADDGAHGLEPWVSDGTEAGTRLVKDVKAGSGGSAPLWLTAGGSRLFFTADQGAGSLLWMSDGTEAGTRVLEIAPATAPQGLAFAGGTLYFAAQTEAQGREPYTLTPAYFEDCTPPTLTCPADQTLEATGPPGATVVYSVPVTDNAPAAPTVTYSQASGTSFAVKATPVTVIATDATGNSDTCTFTITVKDTRPPTLTCPANVEATAIGPAGVPVEYSPAQATDTVSGVTLSYSTPSGSTFVAGTNQVQVTATDASGNAAACTFSVKVAGAAGEGTPGCGCASGFAGDVPWLLLGMLTPLMARRRRSSR